MSISVERTFPSGLLILRTTYRGNEYKHRYMGYTLKEAKAEFREYVKKEDSRIFRAV